MADDIRQSLELNAKQVLDELERLKTSFTSYNDRLGTTANRLDSVTDSAKRTLSTLRDLRTEARLVEKAMGSIGTGTRSLGPATSGKVSGGALLGGKDASKAFDQFFTDCTQAQVVASKTGQTVSTAFDQIQRDAATKVVPAGKAVQASTESMWLSWQTFARVIQTQLFVRGMNAVRDAFTESASAAMEFSSNISNIRAINPERTFGEIAASVRTMSDSFNQSLDTVSRAQLEVISDQFSDTADMVNILTAANKLAKATGEDLVPTAQLLTGALNAYGESADMAEVRAAQFFTTIDLGRLKSGELATALGRVQSIGNSVGAEMEELDAALAAITIGGVKANEASTQLRGILIGLLKPTEDMKKALAKLGFDSGEVAVKALGLQGALQALIGTTDGATSSIAALFQNQRALAGVLRLVNTGADAYQKSLAGIYDTETAMLDSKLGERMQTDAERLTAATNQLKNFWTAEFGADVVEKLNTVIQLVGGGQGLTGAFRTVTETAPKAAIAIGLLTAATAKWGLAADVATAKFTNGVGLGISKVGTLSNALAVFGAYEILTSAGTQIALKVHSHIVGPIVSAREAMQKLFREEEANMAARIRLRQRAADALIRLARQEVAEANIGYLRDEANYKAAVKSQEEEVKSAFDRIMRDRQRMQSQLKEMSRDAATQAGEVIPRTVEGIQRRMDDRKTSEWINRSFAPEEQFGQWEALFLRELDAAARLQATAKDTQQAQKATEAWERVEAYRQQATESAKISAEAWQISRTATYQDQIDKRRIDSLQQQSKLQQTLADTLDSRAIQAEKHSAELEKLRAVIESQLETTVATAEGGYRNKTSAELKRDIGQAEVSIAQFQSLLTKYGREDFTAAFMGDTRAFASLRREATKALSGYDIQMLSIAPTAIERAHVELQASFDRMILQVPAIAVLMDYTGLDVREVGPDALLDAAQKKLRDYDAQREKYVAGMGTMRTATESFGAALAKAWDALPAVGDLYGLDAYLIKLGRARQDTDLTQKEIDQLIEEGKRLQVSGAFQHFGLRTGTTLFGAGAKWVTQGPQWTAQVNTMLAALQEQSKAQKTLGVVDPKVLTEAYTAQVAQVRSSLTELEEKKQAQINIADDVQWELDSHGRIHGVLKEENNALREKHEWLKKINNVGESRGMAFGGWFAKGGYPRGFDTIPAMLSPGEFVVNAASSRRFASQLVAMNAGIQPTFKSEGGKHE